MARASTCSLNVNLRKIFNGIVGMVSSCTSAETSVALAFGLWLLGAPASCNPKSGISLKRPVTGPKL